MKVVSIYGSATDPGRLASALDFLEECIRRDSPQVDLTRISPYSRSGDSSAWWEANALAAVAEADGVVIASPVYRASFPAVLKELLDNLSVEDLRSKTVATLVVAHASEHYLAVRRHLTDVLDWFGALVLPAHAFVTTGSFQEGRPGAVAQSQLQELSSAFLDLLQATSGRTYGPAPLALQRSS